MAGVKSHNTVRIIGGVLRSRKIEFPDLQDLRPTGDRIRETVFNWLQTDIPGARCLDVFAGSGALGFEAASRGADEVVLLENNRRVASTLKQSIHNLQLDNVELVQADSLAWLQQSPPGIPFDIVFVDPPFAEELLDNTCAILDAKGWLAPDARIYLESPAPVTPEQIPAGWIIEKSKKSGEVYYYLSRAN